MYLTKSSTNMCSWLLKPCLLGNFYSAYQALPIRKFLFILPSLAISISFSTRFMALLPLEGSWVWIVIINKLLSFINLIGKDKGLCHGLTRITSDNIFSNWTHSMGWEFLFHLDLLSGRHQYNYYIWFFPIFHKLAMS